MAQPTPYERQFAFSGQPRATWAEGLENELNAVKVTSDETLANLELIQRDDGALRNGIVTRDSLAPDLALAGLVALDFADEATAVAATADNVAIAPLGVKQQIDARLADQATAEAGTDNSALMTPLRTKQQADARLASQPEAEAGSNNTKTMTPLRTKQSIDENALTPLGESTTAAWPNVGNVYAATDGSIDAATVRISNSAGTHTRSRMLDHMEMHVDGCGEASAPDKADHVVSRSIFKNNFPSLSAQDGEIDVSIHAYRQVNGDASCHLGNGVVINGFGCYAEYAILSIDPVTFEAKHYINGQDAVVNDRDGGEYGLVRQKAVGAGGAGIRIADMGTGSWDRNLEFVRNNKKQLVHRATDGTLEFYAYNDETDWTEIEQISGGLRLTKPTGEVYHDLESRPVNYTLNPTQNAGSITTTTHQGYYIRRGKSYTAVFDFTVDTTSGGAWINLDIPAGLVPINMVFAGCGFNANTGQSLAVNYGGGKIQIRSSAGAFPATAGHRLAGTIEIIAA